MDSTLNNITVRVKEEPASDERIEEASVSIYPMNVQIKQEVTANYVDPIPLFRHAIEFFYKNELRKSQFLCMETIKCTEDDKIIKSEAFYLMGRCFHVQKDYDRAFNFYTQASLLEDFVQPHFGLGKIHIQRENYYKAIDEFEYVHKHFPNCTETLKILGSLYIYSEKEHLQQRARNLLTKYIQAVPNDAEALLDLAQLIEYVDPHKSLILYEKAVKLRIEAEEEEIPPEIMNNIASLYVSQGKYDEALSRYKEAEEKLIEFIATEDFEEVDLLVTVKYNIARCMEWMGLYDEAEQRYKDILKEDPNYIDCILRCACLAFDRGHNKDALLLIDEAATIYPDNLDPPTMIGLFHMRKNEVGNAQKIFEQILQKHPNDAFSLVILGNIWMKTLFKPFRKRENDHKAEERALDMYVRALKIQPNNIWAANGIGCIMAHKKRWDEAGKIFLNVREATSDFFDVWMNIALIYLQTKNFASAVQIYTTAMNKFGKENDPFILASLACAHYANKNYEECKEVLKKAMEISPNDITLQFNYAFILKKTSKKTLENVKSTCNQVNQAVEDLKTAEKMFIVIQQNKDFSSENSRLVSRSASGDEANQCQDLLKQAETCLSRAIEQDTYEEEMRQKQEVERAATMQKILQQRREKDEMEAKKREEGTIARKAFIEMKKSCIKLPEIREDEKKPKNRKKKKEDKSDEDSSKPKKKKKKGSENAFEAGY